jgi:hypothetical protein
MRSVMFCVHSDSVQQRVESFMMQKLICQVFWSVTHYDIPAYLRKPTGFRPWMDLFTKVLQQPVEIIPPEEMDEAHNHQAWKTRKWVAVSGSTYPELSSLVVPAYTHTCVPSMLTSRCCRLQECIHRLYERYGDPKMVEQLWPKPTVKFAERFMKVSCR